METSRRPNIKCPLRTLHSLHGKDLVISIDQGSLSRDYRGHLLVIQVRLSVLRGILGSMFGSRHMETPICFVPHSITELEAPQHGDVPKTEPQSNVSIHQSWKLMKRPEYLEYDSGVI